MQMLTDHNFFDSLHLKGFEKRKHPQKRQKRNALKCIIIPPFSNLMAHRFKVPFRSVSEVITMISAVLGILQFLF